MATKEKEFILNVDGKDYALKPCPFCGATEDLQILNQGDVVGWECHYDCPKQEQEKVGPLNHTWFVNCPTCGSCGPDFYVGGELCPASDEECKAAAIEAWNRRDGKRNLDE